MIIEKSPFYNKKIDLSKDNSEKLIEKNQATKFLKKKRNFRFGVGLRVLLTLYKIFH